MSPVEGKAMTKAKTKGKQGKIYLNEGRCPSPRPRRRQEKPSYGRWKGENGLTAFPVFRMKIIRVSRPFAA